MTDADKRTELTTAKQAGEKKPHYVLKVDSARHVLTPAKQEEKKQNG